MDTERRPTFKSYARIGDAIAELGRTNILTASETAMEIANSREDKTMMVVFLLSSIIESIKTTNRDIQHIEEILYRIRKESREERDRSRKNPQDIHPIAYGMAASWGLNCKEPTSELSEQASGLWVRARKAIRESGCRTAEELSRCSSLARIKGVGVTSINQIKEWLMSEFQLTLVDQV